MSEQLQIIQEHGHEEDPKERMERLQKKVWENLHTNDLLQKILSLSEHADEESKYIGVEFWTEIGTSRDDSQTKMWLQIFIKHANHSQPVTPKIYRITDNTEEQKKLSAQIWDGISEDELRFIAKFKADDYHSRDQKNWLSPDQSQSIKVLYPAIESNKFKIELRPDYAQYRIVPEK